MVYYDVKIKYTVKETPKPEKFSEEIRSFNRTYLHFKPLDCVKAIIHNHNEQTLNVLIAFEPGKHTLTTAKKQAIRDIGSYFEKFTALKFSGVAEEIGVKKAFSLALKGTDESERRVSSNICNAYYLSHSGVEFEEFVLPHAGFEYSEALCEAHNILLDSSFTKELERIYSPLNKRKFYGNPVQYMIQSPSKETAINDIKLLAKSLYANKRLLSSRVTYVTDTDFDSYNSEFEELCENSYGSIIAIECNPASIDEDNYARDLEEMCNLIKEMVTLFAFKTLFVLVAIGDGKKVAEKVMSAVAENEINFIELYEGSGNKNEAEHYLKQLLKENKVCYAKEDFVLPKKDAYSTADIIESYKRIRKNSIKNSIYRAYKDCEVAKVEAPKSLSNSYEKLQQLVGLHDIKQIIDQIIAAQKMTKMRKDAGLAVSDTAKHMIFTGNPGSAKTTVARLLSSILFDEHVIEKPKFVECGRQDLVGRYVGWTAQQVEAKFREAKGGILFIDEAYSLVEKEGLYGDEAINTIVQMMENYREEVIVIFAGYPDKMKRFLAKNEGLRSRIAFHIDFPDYNGEELCAILELMCKNRGYTLETGAAEKCKGIFEIACHNAEFGNGRFVRNVLEQAIIKQSARLVGEYRGKPVDRETMTTLSAADFDINAAKTYKPTQLAIGF